MNEESSPPATLLTHDERIAIARAHFQKKKGYRVHSGLQFGCELVLYADSPGKVHSDFCVHVVDGGHDDNDGGGKLDWRTIQTLARSMPDLRKTLIVAHVREIARNDADGNGDVVDGCDSQLAERYVVDELAIATEHAPFRHKHVTKGVGSQVKPQARK